MIKRIEKLLDALPDEDQELGETFLQDREISALQELVDSAIVRVKKSLLSDHPKNEYMNVDLNRLTQLKTEVDMYEFLISQNDEEENGDDYE